MPHEQPWRNAFHAGDLIFGYANSITGWIQQHSGEGASDDAKINVYETDISRAANAAPADAIAFVNSLDQHPKYSLVVSNEAIGRTRGFAGNMNRTWRLKSKGALYWATRDAGKHVHFILDGIDMDEVVDKSHTSGPPLGRDNPVGKAAAHQAATKTRTITHAELRWIYRNKLFPEVRQFTQFWLNNAPCAPPWRTDPATWMRYHPTNSSSTTNTLSELD